MVESFEKFAVNEYLTPNLYRLVEEGLFFPNNYSENRTNYSESIGIIGHYPSLGFSPDNYIYDFSETSLPKILGDNYSYRTSYFHDNVGSFYGRNNLLGLWVLKMFIFMAIFSLIKNFDLERRLYSGFLHMGKDYGCGGF